jgi:hypothetical protein
MADHTDLPSREATREEMDQMSAQSVFLYNHGVELIIYKQKIISLDRTYLPPGTIVILKKQIQ